MQSAWLKSNRLNKLTNTLNFQKFYAPLTSQVEDLDQTTGTTCLISHNPSPAWQRIDTLRMKQHVNFDILDGHIDTDGIKYHAKHNSQANKPDSTSFAKNYWAPVQRKLAEHKAEKLLEPKILATPRLSSNKTC